MYTIYISTFNKKVIKVKHGIPIEVGAAQRDKFLYSLKDSTGDNISLENPFYGELTGLYWVWKNARINDEDIIGFCHYNKCLGIGESKAEKWLSANPDGMITLQPGKIRNHPVPKECKALFTVLKKGDIKYYNACTKLFDEELGSRYSNNRGGNMMLCHGKTFKAYCSWLFPVLKGIRDIIGDKASSYIYWKRYCAYIAERLLSVYIEANQLPALGVDVRLKNWWIPILGKLRRTIGISTKNKLYQILYNKLGYHSSYKKNGK